MSFQNANPFPLLQSPRHSLHYSQILLTLFIPVNILNMNTQHYAKSSYIYQKHYLNKYTYLTNVSPLTFGPTTSIELV